MIGLTVEQLIAISLWAEDNFPLDAHIVLHSDHVVVVENGEENFYRIAEICDEY